MWYPLDPGLPGSNRFPGYCFQFTYWHIAWVRYGSCFKYPSSPDLPVVSSLHTREGKPTCLGELHVLIVKLALGNRCLFNSAVPEAIPVVWNHSLGTVELAPWSFLGFWLERKPETKGPYSISTATIASTLGLAQRICVLKIVLKRFLKNAKNTGILKFGSRNSLLLFLQVLGKEE